MIQSNAEILTDIDETLNQLIINAKMMQQTCIDQLDSIEMKAMQKTQESLLARLIDMNQLLENQDKSTKFENKSNIHKKLIKYGKWNEKMIQKASDELRSKRKDQKAASSRKRRSKSLGCGST